MDKTHPEHDRHANPLRPDKPDKHAEHQRRARGEHEGHGHEGEHHAGHEAHGGHAGHGRGDRGDHVGQFRRLFWIMLVLGVPVVGLSPMFADLLGYQLPDAAWVWWVSPILGTVIYIWGGQPFLTGAVSEIRDRNPGMMLLISLAISVAFVASWGATLGILNPELNFWWEMVLLVIVMLLGHWIEMRSLAQTTSALDSLAALLPDEAEKIDGGDVVKVAPADLVLGDVVIVRPGSSVPADGRIVDGSASMDESMVTGESKTVRREAGEQVVAGTVATDSGLRVEVTATGDDTALAGIQKLVADAQASSSRAQRLADTVASWLFWFALGAALITALVWVLLGMPDAAVARSVTVLVIACPHALGLAVPLVVSIATERAARGGVLVKDRLALESMRTVDSVLFDKTGTLTKGEPTVTGVHPVGSHSEDEVLALAAAAESDSEHPLARAIVGAVDTRNLVVPRSSDFSASPAVGVKATVDGKVVEVGGPYLLEKHGRQELPVADQWRDEGAIILHVIADGEIIAALRLADEIRPESRDAVDA
ncbi:heavy metal translocating P-type ATPase, partial [Nesterenkonia alkaliphila]|uniref:heavy metal translocating P-type ATPase n=1 Tax=Nesterenkonia alkaliphila TaxID=1463631 RepID=UPI001664E7C6